MRPPLVLLAVVVRAVGDHVFAAAMVWLPVAAARRDWN